MFSVYIFAFNNLHKKFSSKLDIDYNEDSDDDWSPSGEWEDSEDNSGETDDDSDDEIDENKLDLASIELNGKIVKTTVAKRTTIQMMKLTKTSLI
ncbi:hypothetical protein QE152_g19633 [Popillia japonica]|uniref:Uncharacterized protein n=1 Tax=Popillia japonica TaxID=7064 RepID=A0AAW1KPR5_POPJA